MRSENIVKPKLTLKEPFPDSPSLWVDPITGLAVPKEMAANLRWRGALLDRAREDRGFRTEIYTACSLSTLFWINAFVWTYRLFVTMPDGKVRQCTPKESHVPYITWAIQDEHITEIRQSIVEGRDLLTDKSRDMGATWDHLVVVDHSWIFENDRSYLIISRKEDCVDSDGKKGPTTPADPGTLFGKLDYLHIWLPEWMVPNYTRTTMHLVNRDNGSRIDGESANATAGSSDRRTAILLDEMAKMKEGESIKRSTRDVTACRLANSTPHGAGTAFSQWRHSGQVKVFVMAWWEHPEKGLGRYVEKNDITGIQKIRSPYYNNEELLRTPKEMASELDMDHVGSGESFFEMEAIVQHRALFVRPPITKGVHITFSTKLPLEQIPRVVRGNQLDSITVENTRNGPWSFWMELVNGRPDQTLDYVFGIDIGKGMGASNSIISVGCVQTRMKIAEWASANFAPHDFAQIAVASAIWFGGSQRGNRPLMIWESNGDPGIYFGKAVSRTLAYPNCYIDRHSVDKIGAVRGKKYGWHSSPEKKADLLNEYRRALGHGLIVNPSEAALAEAETYVYYPGNAVGPAYMIEESVSARATHGDRVIGDALMIMGLGFSKVKRQVEIESPSGSFAQRYKRTQQQRAKRKKQETWDNR